MNFTLAILTVIFSGVIAAIISHYLTSTKEARDLVRLKSENLLNSIKTFKTGFDIHTINAIPFIKGEISYNDYLELIKSMKNLGPGGDLNRVIAIIQLYFPELQYCVENILKVRTQFNDILTKLSKNEITNAEAQKRYGIRVKEFDNAISELEKQVILNAQNKTDSFWKRRFEKPPPYIPLE